MRLPRLLVDSLTCSKRETAAQKGPQKRNPVPLGWDILDHPLSTTSLLKAVIASEDTNLSHRQHQKN